MKNILSLTSTIIIITAFSALLVGCASQPPPVPTKDPFFDEWKKKAETSQPYLPERKQFEGISPGKEAQKVLRDDSEDISKQHDKDNIIEGLPRDNISVRFINDDLATSLRTLGRLAQQNILISPNVAGTLNMHIKNTPWDTVFMGIVNSYGLTVTKKENLLHIMSMGDLKQQLEKQSLMREETLAAPLTTHIIPIEFSEPATIASSINLLLSKDKEGNVRGSTSVDTHSRSLIVRDTAENMNKILKLVYDLDKPTPQILIKAQIIETTQDTARNLGIQWGALSSNVLGNPKLQLTPGTASTFADTRGDPSFGSGGLTYPAGNLGRNINLPAAAITGATNSTIGLLWSGTDILLDAQLSALQKEGKVNILSSPSIATLDNSQAIIESGREVPYATTSDGGTQTTFKKAVLNLTVTPHVISDRMIRLDIDARKDEIDPTSNGILTKWAKTQLIVENGATVIIAGLSKESTSKSQSGVPGAKDMPVLGNLFKNISNTRDFEELLIFITPKILTRTAGSE